MFRGEIERLKEDALGEGCCEEREGRSSGNKTKEGLRKGIPLNGRKMLREENGVTKASSRN